MFAQLPDFSFVQSRRGDSAPLRDESQSHFIWKRSSNGLIFQQVTIGLEANKPGAPILGRHVDVGAGAKILGGVTISDHALIGANAAVLDEVPEAATAAGIPAKIVSIRQRSIAREEIVGCGGSR